MIEALVVAATLGSFNDDLAAVLADLQSQPAELRLQARYISLTSLPDDQHKAAARCCSYLLNSMAALTHGDITTPQAVPGTGGRVIRFFMSQYTDEDSYARWHDGWENLAADHPHSHFRTQFIASDTGELKEQVVAGGWIPAALLLDVQTASGSTMPLLDVHHWFARCSDATTYYELLGATDVQSVFDALGIDVEKLISLQAQHAATVRSSRVALGKPRRIIEYRGPFGGNWITFDVAKLTARNDAIRNPLSIIDDDQGESLTLIQFDASEFVLSGRNGLPVFLAADPDGTLQKNVPPEVAHDFAETHVNFNHLIAPPISCIRCHTDLDGLNAFVDHQQALVAYGQTAASPRIAARIAAIYNAPQVQRRLEFDGETFAIATEQATRWDFSTLSTEMAALYRQTVLNDVDALTASVEIGTTVEQLKALCRSVADPHLLDLAHGLAIPRAAFADSLHLLLLEREKNVHGIIGSGNDGDGQPVLGQGGSDDPGNPGDSASARPSAVALRNTSRIPGRQLRGSLVSASPLRFVVRSAATAAATESDVGDGAESVRPELPVPEQPESGGTADTGDGGTETGASGGSADAEDMLGLSQGGGEGGE